jgi:peptide/nickel transport system permease protein
MKKFLKKKSFVISTAVLMLIIVIAVFAGYLAPYNPLDIDASNTLKTYSPGHPLGTDNFGRDILSRILFGLQPSLIIASCATILAMVFGTMFGMLAGFSGKVGEQVLMRIVDIILCFPSMLLAIMIVSFWGPGINTLITTITIVFIPTFARLAYGTTLKVKAQEYIEAQVSLGAGFGRVLLKGILPNMFSSILVQMSLTFGNAVLLESGLSFLGVGVIPPTPSLGGMIGDAQSYFYSNYMFLVYPSILLVVLILSINIFGDSLRDILDPRLNK